MKRRKDHSQRNFWLAILGILGFPSCNPLAVEYGTPSALFKVNGTVTNAQTEQPISAIKVLMIKKIENPDTTFNHRLDSTLTNEKGEFALMYQDFPTDKEYIIQFVDTDGETNGLFENRDTLVSFIDADYKDGNGNWYFGETEKEIEVKLKQL